MTAPHPSYVCEHGEPAATRCHRCIVKAEAAAAAAAASSGVNVGGVAGVDPRTIKAAGASDVPAPPAAPPASSSAGEAAPAVSFDVVWPPLALLVDAARVFVRRWENTEWGAVRGGVAVCRAFLAEHDADDGDAINDAWLMDLGAPRVNGVYELPLVGLATGRLSTSREAPAAFLHQVGGGGDCWAFSWLAGSWLAGGGRAAWPVSLSTRGEVRALVRLLGQELCEPPAFDSVAA